MKSHPINPELVAVKNQKSNSSAGDSVLISHHHFCFETYSSY
jgi:hypothetical protein